MTNPDTPAPVRHSHWRVSVETSGEHIVSIEPEMLAGREPSDADTIAIRTAAHHLLAFIGDPANTSPEPQTRGEKQPEDCVLSIGSSRVCAYGTLGCVNHHAPVMDWADKGKLTVEQAWTILCETPDITSPEEYPDHALITMEQLGSFMARAQTAVPEGWKLVPLEPKPEMLGAWYRYKNGHHWPDEPEPPDTSDYGAYRAMLAAAPKEASHE